MSSHNFPLDWDGYAQPTKMWEKPERTGATVLCHNGGTFGFSSYLGWESKSGEVVVVLTNSHAVDATSLGQRIIMDAVERK